MDVWLTIQGTQHLDGESETVEMSTAGRMTPLPEGWQLTYAESEASGMPGVDTTLTVTPDCVTMTRSGRVQTQLVLERGRRHQCAYDTGFGVLQIGLFTDIVDSALSADGGSVYFSYTMDQNGRAISAHEVRVTVSVHEKG